MIDILSKCFTMIIDIFLKHVIFIFYKYFLFYAQNNWNSVLMEQCELPTSINSKPNHENLHGYISDVYQSMKNCIIVRNDKIPHKIFLITRNCGYWDGLKQYCTVKLKGMISYNSTFLGSFKLDGIQCNHVIWHSL